MSDDEREAGLQDDRWREVVATVRAGATIPFAEQWNRFTTIFAGRAASAGPPLAWTPDPADAAASNLGRLLEERGVESVAELHRWSVSDRAGFWRMAIRRLGIRFQREPDAILDDRGGPTRPIWLPGAELNIADSCFQADANKTALIVGREGTGERVATTYGALEAQINRFANALRDRGYRRGSAIALFMPMTLECVVAYLGIVKAGACVVSIPDSFSAPEVRRRLDIAEVSALVTVAAWQRAGRKIALYDVATEALRGREAPCRVVVVPEAVEEGSTPLRQGDSWWREFLAPDERFSAESCTADAALNVLFSSGTTGSPKAIPWTHATPIKCAMDGHFHHDIRPHDVVAWPTNIGWMMGPWLIFATFVNRATMALFVGSPGGEEFVRFVRDAGVSVLGVVPTLVRAWRTADLVGGGDWAGVRVLSSTGEPSNRGDYLWLMSRTHYRAPVVEYLGGTEIGGGHITGTVVQPASPSTFTTPALGIDVVVLDGSGRPVVEGATGEMFLVPPSIGLSQTLLNKDHDEVYYAGCPPGPHGEILRRHGDEMTRLHHGFYRAQGRADDTMNLGGVKVSSLELERVVETHPGVYECAAVGVQREGEGSEELILFVVTRPEAVSAGLHADLQRLVSRDLNPLFRVGEVVLMEKLPRTASNKLMRRELRQRFQGREAPG